MFNKEKVIIDCSPGIYDCIALLCALGSNDLHISGVTTVSSDISCNSATRNTLKITNLANRNDLLIYKGENREDFDIKKFNKLFNINNMSDVLIESSTGKFNQRSATEFYKDELSKNSNKHDIIILGPATNLAKVVTENPDLVKNINSIICAGGCFKNVGEKGNITPFAEKNVYIDTKSFKIINSLNTKIVHIPLELSEILKPTDIEINKLKSCDSKPANVIIEIIELIKNHRKTKNNYLFHSSLAILYKLYPEFFTVKEGTVRTNDTANDPQYGSTSFIKQDDTNRFIATEINKTKFYDMFYKLIANL
jgi:purine nucleosidase